MLPPGRLMPIVFCALFALAGCTSTGGQLGTLQTQNRGLLEQSKTQLAEIENLKSHTRRLEDKLIDAEHQLALLEHGDKPGRQRLVSGGGESGSVFDRDGDGFDRIGVASERLPGDFAEQFNAMAARFESFSVDPHSATARLDADSLFESGDALLRAEGERPLRELARILQSTDARGMKIMVVGHTDDQKPVGDRNQATYADNWELSMARALAVASYLQEAGVTDEQMGVAGFGDNQPVASNDTSADRRKNRRVEIHIVGPDTPVVGWIQRTPSRR